MSLSLLRAAILWTTTKRTPKYMETVISTSVWVFVHSSVPSRVSITAAWAAGVQGGRCKPS